MFIANLLSPIIFIVEYKYLTMSYTSSVILPTYGAPGTIHYEVDEPITPIYREHPIVGTPSGSASDEGFPLEAENVSLYPTIDRAQIGFGGPIAIGNVTDIFNLAKRYGNADEFYKALKNRYQTTDPIVIGDSDLLLQYADMFYTTGGWGTGPDTITLQ